MNGSTELLKKKLVLNKTELISLCVVIVLIIFMTAFNPKFLGEKNLRNLFMDMSTYMIMGAGIMMVLLIGSIDLSTGAVCSLAAVMAALSVNTWGAAGLIFPLLFGIAAGFINGVLLVFVRIPSFIATLATMSVWSSMALLLSNSASVSVSRDAAGALEFLKINIGVFSMPFIIGIVVVVIAFFLVAKTKYGKYLYAVGANETAARMCGAPVRRTKLTAFTICGLLSALVGVLLVAKLKSASPYVGDDLSLLGIAAAVLGGISLSGGRGHALWMVIGCAVVAIVQNGISVIGVPAFYQEIVYGTVIMIAIFITADRKMRNQIIK